MTQVFVSYDARDIGFVEESLVRTLRDAGFQVWYAKADIRASLDWDREVRTALKSSRWFVVLLSPNSAESEHVRDEIHWAMEHLPEHIVPVLIEECDLERFHLRISRIQRIDARRPSEVWRDELREALGMGQSPILSIRIPSIVHQEFESAGESVRLVVPQRAYRDSLVSAAMSAGDELELSSEEEDWELTRNFASRQVLAIARILGQSFEGEGLGTLIKNVCVRCMAVAHLRLELPEEALGAMLEYVQASRVAEDVEQDMVLLLRKYTTPAR